MFKWNSSTLKVWSTVKIHRTRVPQNAIVPVGRPRPYSIIILNMRFIPKASLRASSQITASSYILQRHLWVKNSKPFALTPSWSLACKQTDCITGGKWKLPDSERKTFVWLYAIEDVGPTLYKCHTNVLCLLGAEGLSLKHCTFIQCWFNVGPAWQTLA